MDKRTLEYRRGLKEKELKSIEKDIYEMELAVSHLRDWHKETGYDWVPGNIEALMHLRARKQEIKRVINTYNVFIAKCE